MVNKILKKIKNASKKCRAIVTYEIMNKRGLESHLLSSPSAFIFSVCSIVACPVPSLYVLGNLDTKSNSVAGVIYRLYYILLQQCFLCFIGRLEYRC